MLYFCKTKEVREMNKTNKVKKITDGNCLKIKGNIWRETNKFQSNKIKDSRLLKRK